MARTKRTAATRSVTKVKEILEESRSQTDEEDGELVSPSVFSGSSMASEVDTSEAGVSENVYSLPRKSNQLKSNQIANGTPIASDSKGAVDKSVMNHSFLEADFDSIAASENVVVDFGMARGASKNKQSKSKKSKKSGTDKPKLAWQSWVENELQDVHLDACSEKLPMQSTDPPPELLMPLLPFQKEWLWWSLRQETSEIKGGILADEMGMGKTIQAISLIVTSRARAGSPQFSNAEKAPAAQLPQLKGTLVVCPLVAVIQWKNEVARFTKPGSVSVLVYHGAKRCKDIAELSKHDIVLTTYSTLESDYRINVSPDKIRCIYCGKLFNPDRLRIHQNYFCGPLARKTEKQARQMKKKQHKYKKSLQMESKDTEKTEFENGDISESENGDISSDTKEYVPKRVGRGRKRKIKESDLKAAIMDAVEHVDTANVKPASKKGLSSLLHSVRWNRIILDEAHIIKDRKCSTAKSVFALQSNFKWALSGTPLQNRVGELYSLVRFLEVEPYAYYYCKSCDCKSLDYISGKCTQCQHSSIAHFCWWNKFISNPIKSYGYNGEGHKAMQILKHKLLNHFLLRRTKVERAADLALPHSSKFLRRDYFDAREEDFYQALYTQSQSQFNTYVDSGTLLNNYAHIFDLLTRLRQAVDHPYLVVYSRTVSSTSTAPADQADAVNTNDTCSICHDVFEEPYTTACDHTFCKVCIIEYASSVGQSPPCPVCRFPLTIDFTASSSPSKTSLNGKQDNKPKGYKRSSILNRIDLEHFQTSTKIDALREEIEDMLERDATAKAIVFSQFTSFLDLIGYRLEKLGVKCVKLDGSMSITARDEMISRFTKDLSCKVFLMSLKAGGVALNLTVASHVFLMDPWWNPAVEQQAQDRIHRLGQYKPIRIVRFIIENTIEERILKLQEKKQLVFEGTVGGSNDAISKLTEQDLRFLFTR